MTKEEAFKARKLAEQAEDRERMARIVKRHLRPAPRKTSTRGEAENQAAAAIVTEALKG